MNTSQRSCAILWGLVLYAWATSSQAVPVRYEVFLDQVAIAGNAMGSFTYTSPDFIVAPTILQPSDLDACSVHSDTSDVCGAMFITPHVTPQFDGIGFAVGPTIYTLIFTVGDLEAFGSYESDAELLPQRGRLIVSAADATTIPEPTDAMLIGIGLIALIGAARVRRRRRATT
jgi:hypothetical protein